MLSGRWSARIGARSGRTSPDLRVRMAIHHGQAEVRGGDFFGPTLNRGVRLLATGHGGQVIVC